MTGSANKGNPFVGPRPFETGERLWGRDREIRKLDDLLSARRIVILCSPSGAGKSSLVQAGLVPRLKPSFDIWGPTRVRQEANGHGGNRYVLSTVRGFEEGIPERLRRPTELLAGQTLADYVAERPRRRSAPDNILLVFDQFEEILTVDPLALQAKREFFDQLGALLREPQVWALFVLREEFLVALDPYAEQVPTHLKHRFRLDLLGLDGAREAMVNPAQSAGREFTAAESLIRDLATMKVQQFDGSFVEQTGNHVEPVQLQVVCRRLWEAIPEDERAIRREDVKRFGNVGEALAGYYTDSVENLGADSLDQVRAIRDWFGEKLITADGIRGQVRRGAGQSDGLPNEIVDQLLNTHLVRADKRAGATWYELSHDRLLVPVRESNAAWKAENLSEAQQRAQVWEREGRPPGLLLQGQALREAEKWAEGSALITPGERLFLEESRKSQDITDRNQRQARRIRWLAVLASIGLVIALIAAGVAWKKAEEAEVQRLEALSQKREAERQQGLAAQERDAAKRAEQKAQEEFERAEVARQAAVEAQTQEAEQRRIAQEQERLARQQEAAATTAQKIAERRTAEAEAAQNAEREAREKAQDAQKQTEAARLKEKEARQQEQRLRRLAAAQALAGRTASMTDPAQATLAGLLAVQAYREHLAAGGATETTALYAPLRLARRRLAEEKDTGSRGALADSDAAVRTLALTEDGRRLAFGGDDGHLRVIDSDSGATIWDLDAGKSVRDLAWSPGGDTLAIAALDAFGGTVQLRDLDGQLMETVLQGSEDQNTPIVHTLAFHPGTAARLVFGDDAGRVTWINTALENGNAVTPLSATDRPIRDLAWNPAGQRLAVASGDEILVRTPDDAEPQSLPAADVRAVTWTEDGRLAAGTGQGGVLLWSPPWNAAIDAVRLPGHASRVTVVTARNDLLASVSFDGSVRLWRLSQQEVPNEAVVLGRHDDWAWAAVLTNDGREVLTGGRDRAIRRWPTSSKTLVNDICALAGRNLNQQEWAEYLPGVDYEETCPDL